MTICDLCRKPDKTILQTRMSTRGIGMYTDHEPKTIETWELCEGCRTRIIEAVKAVTNTTTR